MQLTSSFKIKAIPFSILDCLIFSFSLISNSLFKGENSENLIIITYTINEVDY